MADIRRLLQTIGRFATSQVDPEFERRKAAEEAKLRQTEAQTSLIGAETQRAEAGTETERLRGADIQQRMDEIRRGREEWQAAVKAGTLKGANAEVEKAMLDAAESDLRRRVSEADIEGRRATTAKTRAETGRIQDPTRQALEMLMLRDVHRQRRAQTEATEALTGVRERGPARQPSADAALRAQQYAEANVQRGRASKLKRFFGVEGEPLLEESSPEYMREIARLKQEYYTANPETAGGWAAEGPPNLRGQAQTGSMAGGAKLPNGIYTDPTSGQLFMVRDGQVILMRDQQVAPTGLGQPSVNPENDY